MLFYNTKESENYFGGNKVVYTGTYNELKLCSESYFEFYDLSSLF